MVGLEIQMHLQTFSLAKNDRLLLHTDGIIETANARGELFGLERLKKLLKSTADADYQEFLELLFKAHMDFGLTALPEDDCSAIVIDFHGPLF